MRLSVIVPGVNEFPQVLFTLQSINQALRDGGFEYEVIYINNWCDEVARQVIDGKNRVEDKSADAVKACAGRGNKWLRYLHYKDKLSHWQAKNLGVQNSTGDFLWFVDAHCVAGTSIVRMLNFYEKHHDELNGTMHLPLTYKILEGHRLIYKLVWVPETHELHYSFTTYRDSKAPYEVAAMSTCGMLMSRQVYNKLGGWPKELGIYGGGENFINYSLATMGMKKWIYPDEPLYHHGEKRGYNWNYDDSLRNRFIAYFCACGRDFAEKAMEGSKGRPQTKRNILDDVIAKCSDHQKLIERQRKYTIYEWLSRWKKDADNVE